MTGAPVGWVGRAEVRDGPQERAPAGGSSVAESFKAAFRLHASSVAVVTLAGRGGPVGFTASSVISVSASPAMLAFSMHSLSSSWPAMSVATTVVINFLAGDQEGLARRFSAAADQRFVGHHWVTLASGDPLLPGTQAWLSGRIAQRVAIGGSHLVIVEVLDGDARSGASPLVHRDRAYHRLADL